MARPSERDVKRLFALSGNQCAFPKCKASIAEGSSLIGEICHIKADNPGGPRYAADQPEAQRQAFENLMLMCANHHKVIDDDEESYTAERLLRMKFEHENRSTPLPETEESNAIARVLIDNSTIIADQHGGFAAGTINAQTFSVHSKSGDTAEELKRIEAIDVLWKSLIKFKSEFNDVIFIDTILVASELDAFFSGKETHPLFEGIRKYSEQFYVLQKMSALLPAESESYRLYVSARLWNLHQVLVALYGRSAMLLTVSFKDGSFRNWRDDTLLDQNLRSALPGPVVDTEKNAPGGGLQRLITILEGAFLEEAAIIKR